MTPEVERHATQGRIADIPLSLEAYEKAALERALFESWGDAVEAARLLGIGRSTFYRKAGKHGLSLNGRQAGERRTQRVREAAETASGVGPIEPLR